MSNWTTRPDRSEGPPPTTLLRAHATKTIKACVISDDVIGTDTHFWKGRTVKCFGELCEPCSDGRKPRWYGYLGVIVAVDRPPLIFEFPDGAFDAVDAYRQKWGTLRGSKITAERSPHRANGKVILTLTPAKINIAELPEEFNVEERLHRIWDLKYEPKAHYTISQTTRDGIEEMLERRKNGAA